MSSACTYLAKYMCFAFEMKSGLCSAAVFHSRSALLVAQLACVVFPTFTYPSLVAALHALVCIACVACVSCIESLFPALASVGVLAILRR